MMNRISVEPQPVCPLCGGSGWEKAAQDGTVRRCRCVYASQQDFLLREARIPKRYEHCDLDSYAPHDASQRDAKRHLRWFIDKYPAIDVGLLLIGDCGVGKTHLAVSVLKEIIRGRSDRGLFYDFRDLLREIQGSWNPVSQTSEIEILQPVLDADILVLDELGANKPTEWVRDTLSYIINCRYNDKKVTLFTSNFLDESSKPGEETLTDRIGYRLRSRLYEMCKVIEIRGKDFRREIRQADYRF